MGLEWFLSIILVLAIVGVVVWLVLQVPMPPIFKNAIIAITVIALLVWIIRYLIPSIPHAG